MRRGWLAATVLAVTAACGTGAGEGETTSAPSSTPAATVAGSDLPFCEAFAELLVGPLTEAGLDVGDPATLEAAVVRTVEIVDAVRASAPPEIAGAAAALADGYDAGFAALAAHGYDLARFDAEASAGERAAFEAMGQAPVGPALEDPNDALESYFGDRCAAGVTLPPGLLDDPGTTVP